MTYSKSISIVGAGIGGLTTALALNKAGIRSIVYEQANEIKAVGAGIMLAQNATKILKHLEVYDEIERAGIPLRNLIITNENLKPISSNSLEPFARQNGVQAITVRRSELHRILASGLNPGQLQLGKTLIRVSGGQPNTLHFSDTEVQSDVVIGADGIHSRVRAAIPEKSEYRDAKQACWRGICKTEAGLRFIETLVEMWGDKKRFGFVHTAPGEIYWYALESQNNKPDKSKSDLLKLFSDFDTVVYKIIDATPENMIMRNDIADLSPLKSWHNKSICLLGDAAHATTPNLGQGACQAIEDAWYLSKALTQFSDTEQALQYYQEKRFAKANKIVSLSRNVGNIAHASGFIGRGIRNLMMKTAPASYMRRQNEYIFNIEY